MPLSDGQLVVFWGATPNKGTYITPNRQVNEDIVKDFWGDAFEAYLEANFAHQSFDLNAYKLYAGYLDINKVEYPFLYQSITPYKFTYLAIRISGKTLFYFVNSAEVMPQRIRLYIELDNWGTYIGGAQISKAHIQATNLHITAPNDSYEIKYTVPDLTRANAVTKQLISAYGQPNRVKPDNLIIVATIKYVEFSDYDDVVEVIKNVAFNIKWVAGLSETATVGYAAVKQALAWVQSIFSCTIADSENKAQVINIFLLSDDYYKVPYSNVGAYIVEFNGIRGTSRSQNPGFTDLPLIYEKEFVIKNNLGFTPKINADALAISINAIGKTIYFGTNYNGIQLPYFVGCCNCKFMIQNNAESLLITVSADNKELDITKSFKVAGIANTNTLTFQETLSKAIGGIANLAGGAFQIAAGGAGIVSGTATIANQLLGGYKQTGNGTYIGGGDGLSTMNDVWTGTAGGEYVFIVIMGDNIEKLESEQYINSYGALCDYYISDTYNFYEYISKCDYLVPDGGPFKIIQCVAEVDNIPYTAAQEIEQKLSEGVRLIQINVTN